MRPSYLKEIKEIGAICKSYFLGNREKVNLSQFPALHIFILLSGGRKSYILSILDIHRVLLWTDVR